MFFISPDSEPSSAETSINAMLAAAAANRSEEIIRIAHKFKSSAGNLGALQLLGICREIEQTMTGVDSAVTEIALDELFAELQENYPRVVQTLTRIRDAETG